MRSKEIEEKKKKLKLTNVQKEVLNGILLGDAHLETQNSGKTYRLKIEQSVKHKEYVLHLYDLFKDWVLTEPAERKVNSANSSSLNIRFSTISHASLRFYAHQFYCNEKNSGQKKCVPKLIHRWLTPRTLAYWYMDDGSIKSKQSKGVIFNTQGFNYADVERLVEIFNKKLLLKASMRKQKDGNQIYISGESFESFISLIDPYILPSMRYKLPHETSRKNTDKQNDNDMPKE
jgi:hypothetical protein